MTINNIFQIAHAVYSDDLIEVVLFNTLNANTFTLYFKAEDFDSWATSNLSDDILKNLWDVYEQSPSLFKLHAGRFAHEAIKNFVI